MRIIEFLNTPPGEFFIQKHIQVLNNSKEIEIIPAFWQTRKSGIFYSKKKQKELHLFNKDRQGLLSKVFNYIKFGFRRNYYERANLSLIKGLDPDHIHFHFAPLASQFQQILKKLSITYTISFRGSELLIKSRINSKLQRSIKTVAESSHGLHFVSKSLKDVFEREFNFRHYNSEVIKTIIETDYIERSPKHKSKEGIRLVFIGRLHWVKGLADLLLGIKKVLSVYNEINFFLDIIGDGPEREKLEFMIGDLKLKDFVSLKGALNHDLVIAILKRSDALILPSISEGFPNVVAEAMQLKVPVIASRLPGLVELFDNEELIYFNYGEPQSICDSLHKFSQMSQAQIIELKRKAHDKSLLFKNEEKHIFDFKQFYNSAMMVNQHVVD